MSKINLLTERYILNLCFLITLKWNYENFTFRPNVKLKFLWSKEMCSNAKKCLLKYKQELLLKLITFL